MLNPECVILNLVQNLFVAGCFSIGNITGCEIPKQVRDDKIPFLVKDDKIPFLLIAFLLIERRRFLI